MSVDIFYPVSEVIVEQPHSTWQFQMVLKLEGNLQAARKGNYEFETQLINRLGQIHRSVKDFSIMTSELMDTVTEALRWLRAIGRRINFQHDNPAYWVTQRDGYSPRW